VTSFHSEISGEAVVHGLGVDSPEVFSIFPMFLQKHSEADLRSVVPCLPGMPLKCFPAGVLLFHLVEPTQNWRRYNVLGGLPSTM
jgi:hypothetical protein